jgi:replicative DNA helicase
VGSDYEPEFHVPDGVEMPPPLDRARAARDRPLGRPRGGLRVPPHSIEAESSVLGGLLLDNNAWDRVADVLSEGDFYRYEHR